MLICTHFTIVERYFHTSASSCSCNCCSTSGDRVDPPLRFPFMEPRFLSLAAASWLPLLPLFESISASSWAFLFRYRGVCRIFDMACTRTAASGVRQCCRDVHAVGDCRFRLRAAGSLQIGRNRTNTEYFSPGGSWPASKSTAPKI